MICGEREKSAYRGIIPREELLAKIQEFRLLDDTYMTAFFNGHPELIELVLSIILNRNDLHVTDSRIQMPLKNIQGHSSVLDIYAVDDKGTKYNIEIQIRQDGANPKRARYYSGLIDSDSLGKSEDYDSLPETYVIFFTASDYFGKGIPLYTVNSKIEELGNSPFNDNAHIIYFNGSYAGDDPLGRLAHDFKCKKPSEMFYEQLSERAHTIKETNGGNESMCQIVEELIEKAEARVDALARKDQARQSAVNLLKKNKLSFEEIAECNNMPLEEVTALADELSKQGVITARS
ncbi:MAG: PD-(D/E)XK nuclease family transposase [Ruminococcus sp.]|nr:PD-(D/E)XK nuclease family transposase [Ruminococcus sp.]